MLDILWRGGLALAVGYLLGGVPFGVIVGRRMHGVDVRQMGSGNTGATNVFRVLGWRAALVTAVCDVAKGAVPAAVAGLLALPGWGTTGRDLIMVSAGVAAMVGHVFSPYMRFRGGKGVATAAGVILTLMPDVFLILLVGFVLGIAVTRIVSLSSMFVAVIYPISTWLLHADRPVLDTFAVAAAVLVLWAHRGNMVRLVHGEEPRITMGSAGEGSGRGRS